MNMGVPNILDLTLLYFCCASIVLTLIDIDTKTLPNIIVIPTFIIIVVGVVGSSLLNESWDKLFVATVWAGIYGAFYFALWFFTGGKGLGYGDVKLAPTLGLLVGFYGSGAAAIGFVSAFIIGGIPLSILMLVGRLKRGTQIPLGPFLLVGAWVGILWGNQLASTYVSITGLS